MLNTHHAETREELAAQLADIHRQVLPMRLGVIDDIDLDSGYFAIGTDDRTYVVSITADDGTISVEIMDADAELVLGTMIFDGIAAQEVPATLHRMIK